MSTPSLKTKLFIPTPRPKLVSRPRLIERLHGGEMQPLAIRINAFTFGLLIFVLLFTAACDSSATVTQPGTESPSPDVNLPNEGFQLQTPLVLDNIRFEHITVEDGLSQNGAFAILQDSDGFMWFGTQDGLDKYDGQNFTAYRHDPDNPNSLSDNWIWAIHEDHLGALWIGTLSGGLDRYDRELDQFTHYPHDPDNPQSLSHDEVLAIYEGPDGVLWIGTRGGLDRFDRETEIFTHYQHNPDDPQSLGAATVLSIHETRDGILWVGTEGGGLSRFDRESETFTHFSNDPDDPQSLSDNNVWVIYEDPFEVLWLGTDGGLDRFDQLSGTFSHFQNNPDDPHSLGHNWVRTIFEDPSGALWIGTDGGGLDRFDRETGTFAHYQNDPGDPRSFSHYSVYDIYQDREGVLWIGTYGGGLNKLFLGGLNYAYFNHNPNDPTSLSNNDIRGIYQDQSGTLWVGTNGGLNRLDQGTGQWRHYQHDPDDPDSLSSNIVGDVYEDQQGLLWIGTFEKGLNSFDPETERFTRYQADPNDPSSLKGSAVTEIYQDQLGILWIGTLDGGLNSYDRESGGFTHYQSDANDPDSINSDSILSIFEDQQGLLWIGTFGDGLNKFDRENEKFAHFQADSKDSSSLSNNLVTDIYEDRGGTLWIGTAGGLNKFDQQTETFRHYREKDGLPNDLVYGILEDEGGDLWMSTNHGLSRFNPQTETFKNFDVNDGLQSNEFNSFAYHKSSSGEMFFGGINGLNAFYPDRIQENNPYLPPVALTRLTQGSEDIDLGQTLNRVTEVTLNWPNNFFEFEFAALSYAHPEENQYAYLLEGLDDDWIDMGTRGYGRYTNLPGGSYTLRMIGSNNDGIWNEEGTLLKINVVPPFWETWWFRGAILLILVGGVIGGYRLRVRSVEARSRELEKLVEERTTELSRTNVLLVREIADRKHAEAKLAQRAADDAVVEERRRLARELHDSVTQSLHGSTLLAEAGQRLAKAGDLERTRGYLARIGEISQQALKEMRLLVYELRPFALKEVGLIGALQQRIDAVERRAGVEAQLSVEGEIELPEIVEDELFRIAQEALNNALKHAKPASVVVTLRVEGETPDQHVILEVADDGVGFDAHTVGETGGIGLVSMRERTEKLGGDLVVRSTPGKGTSVKAIVELRQEKHG